MSDSRLTDILRRVRELELVARKNASGFFGGNYVTSIRGKGLEFHEARKYVFGESVRMIDWNITARMNEPYVKTFLDEREREIFIALDVSPSMHSGWQEKTKLEYALEMAATLAYAAARFKDRLGYLTFSDRTLDLERPRRDRGVMFRMLKAFLRRLDEGPVPVSHSDIRAAIHSIQKFRGKRFVVFLISDFIDHDMPEDLKYLQARHDVSFLHVYDPLEYAEKNPVRFPAFSPEGAARRASIQPGSLGSLAAMRRFLEREAARYGVSGASLSTRMPPARLLMEFFHQKQKRYI